MFESKKEANRVANLMRQEYGVGTMWRRQTMSEREFEQFQGITPESMELFGNMLGLDSTGNEAQDKAFQTYLRKTKANRSAMKRLIHRKGICRVQRGCRQGTGSVCVFQRPPNRRSIEPWQSEWCRQCHTKDEGEGALKDVAIGLHQYITKPQEGSASHPG